MMQELNRMIVHRMHTGIAVLDKFHHIILHNEAAERLLQLQRDTRLAADTFNSHPGLQSRLLQWISNPQMRTAPLQLEEGSPDIQLNFTRLASSTAPLTLVFIDDNRLLAQQAQQLKLASLGQLTANIAHEVRNPLAAISHASQLLNESDHLSAPDQRLATIIHNHCKRVNGIIENVLQLSRRQRPMPQRRELQTWLKQFIPQYIQQHTQNINPDAQLKPVIELELTDTPLNVTVDFTQIEQVLANLCDNALRYSLKHSGQPTCHPACL
jgi:two-component system sensor histidine kinase PilS (NtrC family)